MVGVDIQCTVLDCSELETSRGMCQLHLRRYIDGYVYEDLAGDLVDHCVRDHPLTGDNLRWESTGGGKKRRRCRECLREKARRQQRNHAAEEPRPPAPFRPKDVTLTQAIDDFAKAQEFIDAKCKDEPGPWMDWDDPPTQEEADDLCHGCPLIQACANYAISAREWHGVWGGLVIHEGKVLEYED